VSMSSSSSFATSPSVKEMMAEFGACVTQSDAVIVATKLLAHVELTSHEKSLLRAAIDAPSNSTVDFDQRRVESPSMSGGRSASSAIVLEDDGDEKDDGKPSSPAFASWDVRKEK
jgi:hypothetical protein